MLAYAKMLLGRTGGSAALDTQQVTSGADGRAIDGDRRRGFLSSGVLGSCIDATSNLYGGAEILELYWDEGGGTTGQFVEFSVSGIQANSGWTTMTVDAVAFSRASATFSASGGATSWTWLGAASPFGANGSNHSVTFT